MNKIYKKKKENPKKVRCINCNIVYKGQSNDQLLWPLLKIFFDFFR